MGAMKEGPGTRELASLSSLGDGLLDSAPMCDSNSLTGIVHMQGGGWVGHTHHQGRGLESVGTQGCSLQYHR